MQTSQPSVSAAQSQVPIRFQPPARSSSPIDPSRGSASHTACYSCYRPCSADSLTAASRSCPERTPRGSQIHPYYSALSSPAALLHQTVVARSSVPETSYPQSWVSGALLPVQTAWQQVSAPPPSPSRGGLIPLRRGAPCRHCGLASSMPRAGALPIVFVSSRAVDDPGPCPQLTCFRTRCRSRSQSVAYNSTRLPFAAMSTKWSRGWCVSVPRLSSHPQITGTMLVVPCGVVF